MSGRRDALLRQLESSGKAQFTLHTLMEISGLARPAANQLASRLVDDGALRRMARGLYQLTRAHNPAAPAPLGHLIYWHGPEDFCLSHRSAMAAHGLPPALPHQVMYVTAPTPRRFRYLGGESCLTFFTPAPEYQPTWDLIEVPSLGCTLPVAEPEPTLLEGLRLPKRCGGLLNVARFVALRRDRWHVEALVEGALTWDLPAVTHRLGYLLELAGLRHPALDSLLAAVRGTAVRLDPQRPRNNRSDPRWRVWPNVPDEELKAALGS